MMSFLSSRLAVRTARSMTTRWFASATIPLNMPLDEFRDSVSREQRFQEPVGRSWTVKELRRKSYEDMHKLWYVLYKERNMLLTEKNLSRRKNLKFPQPERWKKVKRSMAAIKVVLGERKREKIAVFREGKVKEEEAMVEEEKAS
mmetsp:Transcript_533/g.965  ORF Transcript_533/g.965 Transcript_533/m.965 type:complete len:145 (-) Transcript_533:1034-1468(-)